MMYEIAKATLYVREKETRKNLYSCMGALLADDDEKVYFKRASDGNLFYVGTVDEEAPTGIAFDLGQVVVPVFRRGPNTYIWLSVDTSEFIPKDEVNETRQTKKATDEHHPTRWLTLGEVARVKHAKGGKNE